MVAGKKWVAAQRARTARFIAAKTGTIAVEFALVVPVVMILFLGIAEASAAISNQLTVQAAARAGAHFGFTKPPVAGNMQPVIDSVKAAMPSAWLNASDPDKATVAASMVCECELTGAIACGTPCAAGEKALTFLKIDVAKKYKPLVPVRHFSTNFTLRDTAMVRLQ